MKISANLAAFKKPLKNIEIVALVIFVVFLLFPFRIPSGLAKLINNPVGFLVIFVIIVFLFLKSHPIVAFVYLLVAYELVRRSSDSVSPSSSHESIPSKTKVKMNSVNGTTELNDTDKNYVSNYKESVNISSNISGDYINYASIGVDSNEADKQKQLDSINNLSDKNTLEEEIIRSRIPTNGLKSSYLPENSSYTPVYDRIASNPSTL
uniref:Uncharacterized protein n=1 Tax=viral metagenome TaxID=1070528 RepID=A0A6C0HYM8_9ZZZZ